MNAWHAAGFATSAGDSGTSRFQSEDFGEEEKFDAKILPQKYLTDPQPGHAFVYVATIQRMAINVLGRQAIFGLGDDAIDEDAAPLDILGALASSVASGSTLW